MLCGFICRQPEMNKVCLRWVCLMKPDKKRAKERMNDRTNERTNERNGKREKHVKSNFILGTTNSTNGIHFGCCWLTFNKWNEYNAVDNRIADRIRTSFPLVSESTQAIREPASAKPSVQPIVTLSWLALSGCQSVAGFQLFPAIVCVPGHKMPEKKGFISIDPLKPVPKTGLNVVFVSFIQSTHWCFKQSAMEWEKESDKERKEPKIGLKCLIKCRPTPHPIPPNHPHHPVSFSVSLPVRVFIRSEVGFTHFTYRKPKICVRIWKFRFAFTSIWWKLLRWKNDFSFKRRQLERTESKRRVYSFTPKNFFFSSLFPSLFSCWNFFCWQLFILLLLPVFTIERNEHGWSHAML